MSLKETEKIFDMVKDFFREHRQRLDARFSVLAFRSYSESQECFLGRYDSMVAQCLIHWDEGEHGTVSIQPYLRNIPTPRFLEVRKPHDDRLPMEISMKVYPSASEMKKGGVYGAPAENDEEVNGANEMLSRLVDEKNECIFMNQAQFKANFKISFTDLLIDQKYR